MACGNGRLSRGIYEGLASEANLVPGKVGTARRIKHDDIRRGLEWVVVVDPWVLLDTAKAHLAAYVKCLRDQPKEDDRHKAFNSFMQIRWKR